MFPSTLFPPTLFPPSLFPGAGAGMLAVPATLEEAIVYLIGRDATLAALVGTRVFPGDYPESQPLPGIVYRTLSDDHSHTLSGAAGISRALVELVAQARKLSDAATIRGRLRAIFQGYRGVVGSVDIRFTKLDDRGTAYEFPDDGADRGTHDATSVFKFTYMESVPSFF